MDQAEFELQLKVWKDLAISKQVLIRAAIDALKLDPDCNADELKKALDAAIKKSLNADASIAKAEEQAKLAIAVMEKKVAESQKAQLVAEAQVKEALNAKQTFEQQMAAERESHINEMKKIKTQLVEKDKTIKDIHKALSDSPENVVKKLKALQKAKFDDAELRKRVEAEVVSLKKDRKKLEEKIKELETVSDNANKLASQHRELHKAAEELRAQLSDAPELPGLDDKLLESLEKQKEGDDK